MTWKKY